MPSIPAERPDVQYQLVAIDFLPPPVLNASLLQLATMLAAERVAPLQQLVYSFADSVSAFRQFARAQHAGKIVVTVPSPAETAHSSCGSWVVSGGLGALGALTAAWLAGQGQRHLVLLGRSGRCGTRSRGAGCIALVGTTSLPTCVSIAPCC